MSDSYCGTKTAGELQTQHMRFSVQRAASSTAKQMRTDIRTCSRQLATPKVFTCFLQGNESDTLRRIGFVCNELPTVSRCAHASNAFVENIKAYLPELPCQSRFTSRPMG